MKHDSEKYLDTVACIATANLVYHQQKTLQQPDPEQAGATLLMSTYLEMYEQWQNHDESKTAPSERIYFAAHSCVGLRKQLELVPRNQWTDEEEGLFQMMTAFMFLFKKMYIPRN